MEHLAHHSGHKWRLWTFRPYQKLRFALLFPALPASAEVFELIEPSSDWKFKDIRCK
ncbi:MAG: hypothetical protein II066_05790 [Prevotella sp.]|nr:hypothetical protein [Prevotella sp.]